MSGTTIVRKLHKNDNFKRVGELLYQVDPFICPDFFGDIERARQIAPVIYEEGGLFDTKHTFVSEKNGELIGILVYADNTIKAWEKTKLEAKLRRLKIEIPKNFDRANKLYMKAVTKDAMKLPDGVCEVELCSIESKARGEGHGQKIFDTFLAKTKYKEYHLTVLRANPIAIHVYEKKGFRIVEKTTGYPDESVKTYKMVRK